MRWVVGILEGLALMTFGLGLMAVAKSPDYWMLLNPRFAWLTGAAGFTALLLGLSLFLAPRRSPRPSHVAIFLLLPALVAVQLAGASRTPSRSLTGGVGLTPSDFDGPGETVRDGARYVPMNTAELYLLCRADKGLPEDGRVLVRGFVRRHPELDARGEVVVARTAVSCCLADAMAIGVRVAVDDPAAYPDGQWARVMGRVETLPAGTPPAPEMAEQGIFRVLVSEACLLRPAGPDAVTQEPEAAIPYIFEIRSAEPFAW